MELLEFIFKSFWNFAGFFMLFYVAIHYGVNGFLRVFARLLRTINILCRGYPTNPNMDADGDIVKATK